MEPKAKETDKYMIPLNDEERLELLNFIKENIHEASRVDVLSAIHYKLTYAKKEWVF